jgi:uncharacterized caspase-like protein
MIRRRSAGAGEPSEASGKRWRIAAQWLLLALGLGATLLVSPVSSYPAGGGPRQEGQQPAAKAVSPRGIDALPDKRPVAPPGDRWALLIGIEKYEHMPTLQHCGDDADRLARALIEHGGYDPRRVRLLSDKIKGRPNPSVGNIMLELDTFLGQAKPEDTVLLAFSGHGEVDAKGRSYLMPIDGNPSSPAQLEWTGIPLDRLHELLNKCPARQKVVVIDACHSGGKAGEAPTTGFDPAKAPPPGRGIVELFSCDAKQVSWEDDELKQGVFSYYLAQALGGAADLRGNRDGFITDDEVYAYTFDEVTKHVSSKWHKEQSPIKHVTAAGRITLAQREDGAPHNVALTAAEIAEQLTLLQSNGASQELIESSRQWLGLDPKFGPTGSMRLLLGLTGQRLISERQFWALGQDRALQIRSYLNAAHAAGRRKMHLVSLGIDAYDNVQRRLMAAVNDARMLKELLSPACESFTLLINDQVTEPAVTKAIRDVAATGRQRDVVLITFSGIGSYLPGIDLNLEGKPADDYGWLLHDCKSKPSEPQGNEGRNVRHRGLKEIATNGVYDPRDGVLSMGELLALIADCKADVAVISDTCYAYPQLWPQFIEYGPGERSKLGTIVAQRLAKVGGGFRTTRVFIGSKGNVIEPSEVQHGLLSFLVGQGLAGYADLETPRSSSAVAPQGRRGLAGAPDGFVTLGELVAFVNRHRGELALGWREEITVWGWMAGDDPVLVRHSLPID